MLGSIMTIAVPFAATLAVALYLYRRITQNGNAYMVSEPGIHIDRPKDSSCHSENRPNTTRHRMPQARGNRNAASQESASREKEAPECAVCFEWLRYSVQMYPCHHSDICYTCVNKIISEGDRLCPFCRKYIQAYDFSSSRY